MTPKTITGFLCVLFAGTMQARAEDGKADAAVVSYYTDVRPILQAHCYGCHQPAKPLGSLDMTSLEGMLKGGDTEDPSIVPGEADAGTLLEMITPSGDDPPEMPKDSEPLSEQEIDTIRRWIGQGAQDDSPKSTSAKFSADNPPKYKLPPIVSCLDFSPDGKLLAVSGYHEVLLHQADGSGVLARLVGLSERIESLMFSPDGEFLAVTGGSPGRMGEIQVWDVDKKELVLSVNVTFDTLYGVSWSHDGKLISFGCGDSTLRAIEVETGKQVFYQAAHNDWVLDSVFSVNSAHLISVGRDRSLKLNEVATQRFVDNITSITPGALKGGLNTVDRHPKMDELLIGGVDGVPKIYQMIRNKNREIGDDYNLLREFEQIPGNILTAEYSADGKRFACGASYNRAGWVWIYDGADAPVKKKKIAKRRGESAQRYDASVKVRIVKAEGIEGGIYAVSFSPDGKVVASGGFAGAVNLHNADDGKLIKTFVSVPLEE